MTYQVIIPVLVAFAISAVLGPIMIPFLRKLKMGQTERKRCTVSSEERRNPDHGWSYHSDHAVVLLPCFM